MRVRSPDAECLGPCKRCQRSEVVPCQKRTNPRALGIRRIRPQIAVPSKPTWRRWEKVAYSSPANIREDRAGTDRHAANVTKCPFLARSPQSLDLVRNHRLVIYIVDARSFSLAKSHRS